MTTYGLLCFFMYPIVFVTIQGIVGHRRGAINGRRPESLPSVVIRLIGMSIFLAAVLLVGMSDPNLAAGIIGTIFIVAGIGVSVRAQWVLGRYWVGGVGLHKRHRLITTGPYRYVRHPLYSGMILSSIGIGIAGWNILFALAAILTWGSFAARIPGEETLLKKRFGYNYQRYTATTGMLFPRIGKRG